jgi:hypothetical protein
MKQAPIWNFLETKIQALKTQNYIDSHAWWNSLKLGFFNPSTQIYYYFLN